MDSSLQTLAAFLTAFGAFIGALVLAYRGLSGDRFTRKITESAALLSGYTEMVKNLRVEISEIRIDHDIEVARTRKQSQSDMERLAHLHKIELDSIVAIYSEERRQWDSERARLGVQIEVLNERIDELGTRVYVLQNQPQKIEKDAVNE